MGTSAGGWNWTEAIVGKSATHRPRSSGRNSFSGAGSWNRGGGSVGSGKGKGQLERVKAGGHERRDSREFTLHAPSVSVDDEDEDGSGNITPTQSNIAAPQPGVAEPLRLVGDAASVPFVGSPGEVDGSLGLGLGGHPAAEMPPKEDEYGVAQRVARLSVGNAGHAKEDKDPKREGLKRTETFGIGKAM